MYVFGQRFLQVLRAATDSPDTAVGDIDVLGSGERKQIAGTNATSHDLLAGTLASLFDTRVAADPDRISVVFDREELTYADFDARVNRLARRLVEQGVGPESVVAVAMRRSIDLLVAIYAVVKAGGAYLPVDPDHPAERTAYVLDTARLACVLVSGAGHPGGGSVSSTSRPRTSPASTARPSPMRSGCGRCPREHGVRDLHVRVDGPAEGRRGHSWRDREPPAVDAARIHPDQRGRRSAEDSGDVDVSVRAVLALQVGAST
jgi:hypothetical protein